MLFRSEAGIVRWLAEHPEVNPETVIFALDDDSINLEDRKSVV